MASVLEFDVNLHLFIGFLKLFNDGPTCEAFDVIF